MGHLVGHPMGHFVGHVIESLICIYECVYRVSNAPQWLSEVSNVIFWLLGLKYGVYSMWFEIMNMRQWAISFDCWWNEDFHQIISHWQTICYCFNSYRTYKNSTIVSDSKSDVVLYLNIIYKPYNKNRLTMNTQYLSIDVYFLWIRFLYLINIFMRKCFPYILIDDWYLLLIK